MDKVFCPWCGKEMAPPESADVKWMIIGVYEAHYICFDGCLAVGPCGYGETKEEAIKAAYEAAIKRPLNRALTIDDLSKVDEYDATWVYNHSGELIRHGFDLGVLDLSIRTGKYVFLQPKPSITDIMSAHKTAVERSTLRPITKKELARMVADCPDNPAVYVVFPNEMSNIFVGVQSAIKHIDKEGVLVYLAQPTPADIEAARKESDAD